MNGQVISYGLAIMLDYDISVSCPYQCQCGRNTIENLDSIRIPSVLCFSNSEITIGNAIIDDSEKERHEYVCGFIRAFQGSLNSDLVAELKRKCSCTVNLLNDGNVEYVIKSMNNQRFSPATLLQLYLQFIVRYEEARVSIPIREIVVVYPPSFTDVHAEYLRHVLQVFSQYRVHCINRLSCEICAFLPSPITDFQDSKRILLFQCEFSTFHVYACSVSKNVIQIDKHVVCTAFSKNSIINRMKELVIRQFNSKMNDTFPKSSYRNVYSACNTVLEKLSLQSIVSIVIYVNDNRFVCRITDFILNTMMDPVKKQLTQDINTILEELHWKKEDLYSMILSGDCYNLVCYGEWIRETFPSTILVSANDITEIFINGIHPSIRLQANELQPDRFYQIFHGITVHHELPEDTLKAILDDYPEKETGEVTQTEDKGPVMVFDEAPNISFTVDVKDEYKHIYSPPVISQQQGQAHSIVTPLELDTTKKSAVVSVTKKKVIRSEYSLRSRNTKNNTKETAKETSKEVVKESVKDPVKETDDQLGSDVFDSEREDYEVIKQMEKEDSVCMKDNPEVTKQLPKKRKSTKRESSKEVNVKSEKTGTPDHEDSGTAAKKRKTGRLREETESLVPEKEVDLKPRQASIKALKTTIVQLQSQKRKRTKKEKKDGREEKDKEKDTKEVNEDKLKEKRELNEEKMKEKKLISKKKNVVERGTHSLPPMPPSILQVNFLIKPIVGINLSDYRINLHLPKEGKGLSCHHITSIGYTNPALEELIPPNSPLPYTYKDGCVYNGTIQAGKRHGNGTLTYPDGSIYQGQFKQNIRHGSCHITFKDVRVFEGSFSSDLPKKGKLRFSNGSCYEGLFNEKGEAEGEGIFYSDGCYSTWDGHWKGGYPYGEGTYFYDNGDYFVGTLVNGKRSGEGSLYKKKGDEVLKTTFVNDLENGKGTLSTSRMCYMQVVFVNGVIEGNATCYSKEGEVIGEGVFHNNLFTGTSAFFLDENTWYKGEIMSNMYHGKGEYHYNKDNYVVGTFDNGNLSGKGQLFCKNSLAFEGTFVAGVPNKDGKEFYPDGGIMYEGSYSRGLRNGRGKLYFKDGSYYLGCFKFGYVSGKGSLFDRNDRILFSASFSRGEVKVNKTVIE